MSDTTPTQDISSLIGNHVAAIQETCDNLPSQGERDAFLMGLRSALQTALPSAMGAPSIEEDVVDCIGRTKLVKLSKIQASLMEGGDASSSPGEVVAKLEFTNPGLSVKDRIAKGMILEAEREGIIQP
jgi:hypothetical protein